MGFYQISRRCLPADPTLAIYQSQFKPDIPLMLKPIPPILFSSHCFKVKQSSPAGSWVWKPKQWLVWNTHVQDGEKQIMWRSGAFHFKKEWTRNEYPINMKWLISFSLSCGLKIGGLIQRNVLKKNKRNARRLSSIKQTIKTQVEKYKIKTQYPNQSPLTNDAEELPVKEMRETWWYNEQWTPNKLTRQCFPPVEVWLDSSQPFSAQLKLPPAKTSL